MTIEEIQEHWKEDSIIRKDRLETELAKSSELLYKYQNFLYLEYDILKKIKNSVSKTYFLLYKYYNGYLSKEDLEKLSRKPFAQKILKSEVSMYIEADDLYQKHSTALDHQEKKCDMLKQIIQNINSRTYTIKSMIDFIKWTSGMQ